MQGPVHQDRHHRVAVAGSTGITDAYGTVALFGHVASTLAVLPAGSEVLLRCRANGDTGTFERVVAAMARGMGIGVRMFAPPAGGRASNYLRDYEIVDEADSVEAYFTDERVMDGGTGHLVEAALNRDRSVRAWRLTPEGRVERVGDHEPPGQ